MIQVSKISISENVNMLNFDIICENIIESLPVGVIAFDNNLSILRANHQAQIMLGVKKNGQNLALILTEGTDKTLWQNWDELLKKTIGQDKTSRIENVSFTSNDQNRLFLIYCNPLKDKNETRIGGTVTIEDITEKVNIERKMENIERFAAVGKLAGKVAHELNNPMDGILRYINLAVRLLEKEGFEKPIEYLTQCRKGLMRMVQIISELLEFSRNTHNAFEDMYLEDIIEDAIKSLEQKIHSQNITIEKEYANNLPRLRFGNLYQVCCNLIKNSIDAMGTDGKLLIKTFRDDSDNLTIEFSDTGPGINPKNINDIFEPFYTTKEHGKGTGLGLAICKDIIEKYNGKIFAENLEDGGSKFKVILPLYP